MFLKKLTLKGFKSFADKVTLDLGPGITAIIGPNGSGKSNISDAILWVLGERNAKNLRGGAMDDVIFSGSSKRQPSGYAEVEMVLDNTDGTLPVDFTEVGIARRAYRFGAGEYLLAGEVVRRSDVLDVLHDTRLGSGAQSIISQGSLEGILRSHPTDRRELIEEAAGVLKYKERMARSSRKLERMSASVCRINDIAREVRRQLDPLMRRAARAKKAADLVQQKHDVDRSLAIDDYLTANRRFRDVGDREAEMLSCLDSRRARLDDISHSIDSIQEQAERDSADSGSISARSRRASRVSDRLESALSIMGERARLSKARASEVEQSLNDARRRRREERMQHLRSLLEMDGSPGEDAAYSYSCSFASAHDIDFQILSGLIEAGEEYEPLVSALLGATVRSLVVNSADDAIAIAKAAVHCGNPGRIDMMSKDICKKPHTSLDTSATVDICGVQCSYILDKISYPDSIKELALALLGDVMVVPTLSDAIIAHKSEISGGKAGYEAHLHTFATKEGIIVHKSGLVSCILPGSQEDVSTLARQRQIEQARFDLEQDVEAANVEEERQLHVANARRSYAKLLEEIGSVLEDLAASARAASKEIDESIIESQSLSRDIYKTISKMREEESAARLAVDEAQGRLSDLRVERARCEVHLQGAQSVLQKEFGISTDEALLHEPLDERDGAEKHSADLGRAIARLGSINPAAAHDADELKGRYDYLMSQLDDMRAAQAALMNINGMIEARIKKDFDDTFASVNAHFRQIFEILFPGGSACLELDDAGGGDEAGVEIKAHPAGKQVVRMSLLSGGEKSLVACAFLFALYRSRHAPFYILDEVEAALDDINLNRLLRFFESLRDDVQLILITHQRSTMEIADVLFGVSMDENGVTKVISQRIGDAIG